MNYVPIQNKEVSNEGIKDFRNISDWSLKGSRRDQNPHQIYKEFT